MGGIEIVKKLSKYSRIYNVNSSYVLFNTINKSIVKIENRYIDNDCLTEDFPAEYVKALEDMGYFADDIEVQKQIETILKRDKKLIISVEVGLGCNMRCLYCYQGLDKVNKNILSDEDISHLQNYYYQVSKIWDFSEIVLKVLGGEPTTMWNISEKVITATSDFCKKNDKKLSLMIDTNGVMINSILKLEGYNSLLLTIPLTNKKCHDNVRKLVNGQGSYDVIISNLNKIHETNPSIKIVLRHNTDKENIPLFAEYIDDLKSKLLFSPMVDISYTTELGDGGFKNPLSYEEYIKWKCGEAIDILAEREMPIMVSPLMSLDRCQYRSRYSLKLFSDGTVGGCAMDFFKKDRLKLKDICLSMSTLDEMCDSFDNEYQKCKQCKSFFLCGGGYNLPCIKSLKINECDKDGAYILDIEQFIKKYLFYKDKNKDDLFVGFNQNIAIR